MMPFDFDRPTAVIGKGAVKQFEERLAASSGRHP